MWIDCLNRYATLILVVVTAIYVILTYCILRESQKDRRVDFLEKRIENLYNPLKELKAELFSLFPPSMTMTEDFSQSLREQAKYQYLREQAEHRYSKLQNVLQNQTYLANKDLKKLLEERKNEFEGLFTHTHQDDKSEWQLPPEIEERCQGINKRVWAQIVKDYQEYEEELHELVGE